jgi:hypothetical protein
MKCVILNNVCTAPRVFRHHCIPYVWCQTQCDGVCQHAHIVKHYCSLHQAGPAAMLQRCGAQQSCNKSLHQRSAPAVRPQHGDGSVASPVFTANSKAACVRNRCCGVCCMHHSRACLVGSKALIRVVVILDRRTTGTALHTVHELAHRQRRDTCRTRMRKLAAAYTA